MSKKKNNVNDLLAAIKRQPTMPTPEKVDPAVVPAAQLKSPGPIRQAHPKKSTAAKNEEVKRGKPVQFWMHDEDRKLVRELSAWLAGQGVRPSDSMVIRAALRLARTGSGLLDAYWQAAKLDGRIKRN